MKAIFVLLLVLSCTGLFAFDFDKDDFAVYVDVGEWIVAYRGYLYDVSEIEEPPKIIEKIKRPASIVNSNGYAFVQFSRFGYFLLDLNGHIIPAQKNDLMITDFSILNGQTQVTSIKPSSELVESTKSGQVRYRGIFAFFRLNVEKESGASILYNALPWVPDLKVDQAPFIEFHLEEPQSAIAILPGFLDFKRQNLWNDNSRVKRIAIIDLKTNKNLGEFELVDSIKYSIIRLPYPTDSVRIALLDYYTGSKYRDPCISSIICTDYYTVRRGDYGENRIREFEEGHILQ